MPNIIDGNGLQVNSVNELLSALTNAFNTIYGANINLDQNTPDAQLINVLAQIFVSYSELLQDINASFDPDQAVGVILDQRVKINGITRKAGTKTTTIVNVTFDGSATLKGQDLYPVEECFTVSDNSGNQLVPVNTVSGVNEDVLSVAFVAVNYGELNFTEGTITNIDTPILGVKSVTNLATEAENVGTNEESDSELRVRRTANAEQIGNFGTIESLKQALYRVSSDIKYVGIEENKGNTEDINGIPAHGIWIIIRNAVADDGDTYNKIANTIYDYRILGTPMKYEEESSSSSDEDLINIAFPITRDDGTTFTAYWSKAIPKNIYCRITCLILNEPLVEDNIKQIIHNTTLPETKETLSTTTIIKSLTDNVPNIVISNLEISTNNVDWTSFITPGVNEYLRIPEANITVTEYE